MPSKQQFQCNFGALRFDHRTNPVFIGLALAVGLFIMLTAGVATATAHPVNQSADEGKTIFETKCAGCHTIGGGKLVGPDLKGVTQLRDQQWLTKFISDPEAMFAANDPVATQLLSEFNNLKMPNLGLTSAEVASVIAYLESAESSGAAAPTAPGAGAPVASSSAAGQMIFTGQQPLANGGTACQACHSVNGVGGLAGGTMGPDLTQVFTRYGEKGLDAALTNIAFPSMVGVFANRPLTPQERADLIAMFKASNQNAPASGADTWIFLGLGLVLVSILFALLLIFWPRQRQSLSQRLRRGQG